MTGLPSLIIVEPWFRAAGHPAQSILNTARVLGRSSAVEYLVPEPGSDPALRESFDEFSRIAPVATYPAKSESLKKATFRALRAITSMGGFARGKILLFLDAHLVALAAVWPWFRRQMRPNRIATVYLRGPERIAGSLLARALVKRFMAYPEVLLCLRTPELVDAWRAEYPAFADRIRHLPSLELADERFRSTAPTPNPVTRFAVVGQVRHGKSLPALAALFKAQPQLGRFTVAGGYADADAARVITPLLEGVEVHDRYLSEAELDAIAEQQHYLLLLHDVWDGRMESATLYLAARVMRPVIVYDEGWLSRMVSEYACGVAIPTNANLAHALQRLPQPDTIEYKALLTGMESLRADHAGSRLRMAFLETLQN